MAVRGVARKNLDIVTNGGLLVDKPKQKDDKIDFCFTEGLPFAILGQSVTPHPPCGSPGGEPHCSAKIITASTVTYVQGIGTDRLFDLASCVPHVIVTASLLTYSD